MFARRHGALAVCTWIAAGGLFTFGLVAQSAAVPVLDDVELLAKAQPDECFYGIGDPGNTWPYDPTTETCPGGIEKANQQYLWALTQSGPMVWFGTAANPGCWGSAFYGIVAGPYQTEFAVCEFGESQYNLTVMESREDWRPPQMFMYNTVTDVLTEMFPGDAAGEELLNTTLGVRSAGAAQGVVFLAGPDLYGRSVNFFAFNGLTGGYLGSFSESRYRDIRKWLDVNGDLYFAVQNTGGRGSVVRWRGNLTAPFQFETVGRLDAEGAELAYHDGRIFAATWPQTLRDDPTPAGIYMSPRVPAGGLTRNHALFWRKVFEFGEYEPDPVNADTYGGGAMASYGGYLFFTTLHVPYFAAVKHLDTYGTPPTQEELDLIYQYTWRATSVFRASVVPGAGLFGRLRPTLDVELLYGEQILPVFNPDVAPSGAWEFVPNNLGQAPLFGPSGFGNPMSLYSWSAAILDGRLYFGLLDLSVGLLPTLADLAVPPATGNPYGADLWRFDSPDQAAEAEYLDGLGNPLNYGIRNLISDGQALYAGSAGWSNLVTDTTDPYPEGGWELLKLSSSP